MKCPKWAQICRINCISVWSINYIVDQWAFTIYFLPILFDNSVIKSIRNGNKTKALFIYIPEHTGRHIQFFKSIVQWFLFTKKKSLKMWQILACIILKFEFGKRSKVSQYYLISWWRAKCKKKILKNNAKNTWLYRKSTNRHFSNNWRPNLDRMLFVFGITMRVYLWIFISDSGNIFKASFKPILLIFLSP